MGGLWKKMPVTWITALIGSLALIGVPFFSGFYSKDSIIIATHAAASPMMKIRLYGSCTPTITGMPPDRYRGAVTSTLAARRISSRTSASSSDRRTSVPASTASMAERSTVRRSCRR